MNLAAAENFFPWGLKVENGRDNFRNAVLGRIGRNYLKVHLTSKGKVLIFWQIQGSQISFH
jgi:hypothetical protein